jgi:hypothetical protein
MLTYAQIAILCDIGQASPFNQEKKGEVLKLVTVATLKRTATCLKLR